MEERDIFLSFCPNLDRRGILARDLGAFCPAAMAAGKAIMSITARASQRIQTLMKGKADVIGLRVGLKTRGCNGLTYTMNYTDKVEKFDEVVTDDVGNKVIVDSKAVMFLIGTEMDYVSDALTSEFVFNNPNMKSECGCGQSFNV